MLNPDDFIIFDVIREKFSWLVVKYQRDTHNLDIAGECDCTVLRLVATIAQKFGGGEFAAIALPLGKVSAPKAEMAKIDPVQSAYVFIHAGGVALKPIPREIVRPLVIGESIAPLLQYLLFLPVSEAAEADDQPLQTIGAPRNAVYDKLAELKKQNPKMSLRERMGIADPDFGFLSADEQEDALVNAKAALYQRRNRKKVTKKKNE